MAERLSPERLAELYAEQDHHFLNDEQFAELKGHLSAVEQEKAQLVTALKAADWYFNLNHVSRNDQGDDEHDAWTKVRAALAAVDGGQ